MRPIATLCVLILCLAPLGCGGGGGGDEAGVGDSGPAFATLFEDDFSVFPSGKWTLSGGDRGYPLGTAVQDPLHGVPTAPSLRLVGDIRVTAFAGAFPTAGGLQIFVRVQVPSDSLFCGGNLDALVGPALEVRDASGGRLTAKIEIRRNACAGGDTTQIWYTIDPDPSESMRPPSVFIEDLAAGSASGTQFWDFSFIIFPDGTASLRRDGVTLLATPAPYVPENVSFTLGGLSRMFLGQPESTAPLHFDDVLVAKPN